ncbi:MAG: hypothetical protein ABSE55_12640 [Terracidiphilus sp.]|jgi:hypothetical protein
MQTTPNTLRPAQAEVNRTAHDQDLLEVPKRARLDREAEGRKNQLPALARTGN